MKETSIKNYQIQQLSHIWKLHNLQNYNIDILTKVESVGSLSAITSVA